MILSQARKQKDRYQTSFQAGAQCYVKVRAMRCCMNAASSPPLAVVAERPSKGLQLQCLVLLGSLRNFGRKTEMQLTPERERGRGSAASRMCTRVSSARLCKTDAQCEPHCRQPCLFQSLSLRLRRQRHARALPRMAPSMSHVSHVSPEQAAKATHEPKQVALGERALVSHFCLCPMTEESLTHA
jgi:hypothetical protein